jgi:XTP/dITP diphosphohydrolase
MNRLNQLNYIKHSVSDCMEIHFATSNENKFKEASALLPKLVPGLELRHFPFKHREIRSDEIREVAEEAALAAYAEVGKPVFVEDAGLFIHVLGGFPGPYSAWVQGKIGNIGILRLLEGVPDRFAEFRAVIAFTKDGREVKTFKGVCAGTIARRPEGESGFGYDPIFVPAGHSQTFAQKIQLKNKLSHRYQSLLEFSKYLQEAQF